MSTNLHRVADLQILTLTMLDEDAQRTVNHQLFVVYETLRLWLKEQRIKGPFLKLVIEFVNAEKVPGAHGFVGNAIGICHASEAVQPAVLLARARDHRWVLGIVEHALECVAARLEWRSPELEDFVRELRGRPLPLVHLFQRLTKTHRPTRVSCVPWLEMMPGSTQLGVRFIADGKVEREVVVLSKSGPIWLEDDFPLARTTLRGTDFVLLDRKGRSLASVPIGS